MLRAMWGTSFVLAFVMNLAAPLEPPAAVPDRTELRRLAARLKPVDLRVDLRALSASERAALRQIVAAARIMDTLCLRQVWAGNGTVLEALATDDSALGRARLATFLQNKGPWLRLD